MTDIETLKRSRGIARTYMTKSIKKLKTLLDQETIDERELEVKTDDLDRRLAALDTAQSEYELQILDPDELEEDLDEAEHIRDVVQAVRLQVQGTLNLVQRWPLKL